MVETLYSLLLAPQARASAGKLFIPGRRLILKILCAPRSPCSLPRSAA